MLGAKVIIMGPDVFKKFTQILVLRNILYLWASGGSVEWLVLENGEIIKPYSLQFFAHLRGVGFFYITLLLLLLLLFRTEPVKMPIVQFPLDQCMNMSFWLPAASILPQHLSTPVGQLRTYLWYNHYTSRCVFRPTALISITHTHTNIFGETFSFSKLHFTGRLFFYLDFWYRTSILSCSWRKVVNGVRNWWLTWGRGVFIVWLVSRNFYFILFFGKLFPQTNKLSSLCLLFILLCLYLSLI